MRTLIGLPLTGSVPISRACATCSRETFFSVFSTRLDERLPEFRERQRPVLLAARDRIELVFERGGEAVLDVAMEVLREEAVDDLADVRRDEALVVHLDVLAILQRRDDRGVGRRPADAVLFERLDERGFREARRRLGEMLLAVQLDEVDGVAFVHRRQDVIRVVGLRVVRAFLVDGDVAGLHQRRAVRAQHVALRAVGAREHVDRDRVEHRMAHLARDRALPDERVEPVLIGVELALDVRRDDGRRCRADGFVRFLRVLRLRLVDARLFRDLVLAVEASRRLRGSRSTASLASDTESVRM